MSRDIPFPPIPGSNYPTNIQMRSRSFDKEYFSGKMDVDIVLDGEQGLINIKKKYVTAGNKMTQVMGNLKNWRGTDGTQEIEILQEVHEDIANIRCMLDDVEFELMRKKMEDTENYISQDALKILGILKDMRKENIMQQKDMKLADIHLNQLRKRSEKVEAKTLRNILHDIMYEDAEIQQKIILMENTLKENDALQKAEKTMQYLGKALTNQRTGTGTGTIIECYMVLTLKILIMITAIMLISASVHISKVKPCELKTALDDISLEYSPHPCKFNSIKDTSSLTLISGIAVVVLNLCLLFVPVCIYLKKYDEEPFSSWISYFAATISVSLVAFIVMMVIYNSVAEKEEEETTLNFLQLESKMLSWLHKTYKSDNTSNGEAVSIQWNVFFIKYDCCGVSEVTGTTNDFDNTPWCTTSGSCQSTASQIPRTCCKSVSLSDYYSAPSSCHASVNDGTYKPSCISRMKALSRDNINEFQLGMLSLSSLTLGMLQAMEFILAIIFEIECLRRKNEKNKTDIQQSQT